MTETISASSEIKIKVSQEEAFNFHKDLSNISKVLPPFLAVKINKIEYPIQKGSKAELAIFLFKFLPICNWKLIFADFDEPNMFVDEAVSGIFKEFSHTHQFIQIGNNVEKSIIRDTIVFSLGISFLNYLVKPFITLALSLKLYATKQVLEKG